MKLSQNTLNILKNYSNINNNLIINPGQKLTTISVQKNIMALADVEETFPTQFGIYSLPDFLGVLSLFNEPDLEFQSKYLNIKEGRNAVKFYAADPSLLTQVPQIKPIPEPDIQFEFEKSVLQSTLKAAAILHCNDFSIVGNGTDLLIVVGDKSNQTSNVYECEIGTTDQKFKYNLKIENLKVIPDTYTAIIAAKRMCKMIGKTIPIEYYIALEMDSQ